MTHYVSQDFRQFHFSLRVYNILFSLGILMSSSFFFWFLTHSFIIRIIGWLLKISIRRKWFEFKKKSAAEAAAATPTTITATDERAKAKPRPNIRISNFVLNAQIKKKHVSENDDVNTMWWCWFLFSLWMFRRVSRIRYLCAYDVLASWPRT